MATFYLIRHGEKDHGDEIVAGRMPSVELTARGRRQTDWIAARLRGAGLRGIYGSPLARAQATAVPLAQVTGLPVQLSEALLEIDFGEWTGRRTSELQGIPAWEIWNRFRAAGSIPGGETYLRIQNRMVGELLRLRARHPDEAVAVIGHGDPLRTVIAYFAGAPADPFDRFEISMGSISVLTLDEHRSQIVRLNETMPEA